jgi:ABC-2 type transport system ATP-binding protein
MKMITGFLKPENGSIEVCGISVQNQPTDTQRKIGYLPESNALYLDMYVKEFLEFIGNLYNVKNVKERVKEMIETTGLQIEQNKKIGALSKGYRQRVGLAQAIIHDPKVLIMDEPTTGLDPNQLEEIRELIKKLGKEKTVMLSTHIMQEVEAVCDRVIIINKGEIVANEQTQSLQKNTTKQIITVEFDKDVLDSQIKNIEGIEDAILIERNTWKIISNIDTDVRKSIFNFAVTHDISILTINKEEQKLEDVFKQLTKK